LQDGKNKAAYKAQGARYGVSQRHRLSLECGLGGLGVSATAILAPDPFNPDRTLVPVTPSRASAIEATEAASEAVLSIPQ